MAENSRCLAEKLFRFNMKLAHWNTTNYSREFNVNGRSGCALTARQFGLLLMIHEKGYATISQFEALLSLSKSSLSLTISKLEKEGYITKQHHKDVRDGRRVFFTITEEGKRVLEEVNHKMIHIFEAFYESLDERQKQDLAIGIEKLDGIFGGGTKNE